MESSKSLKDVKILGGLGGILVLLSGVPRVGFAFSLAGIVLSFLAVKRISDLSEKKEIFRDYLLAFILEVLGIIVIGLRAGLYLINVFSPKRKTGQLFAQALGKLFIPILIGWILTIVGAYFYRKSFHSITEVTKVSLFKVGGTFYLIGAILHIILIGFFVNIVAHILTTVAFFYLPEEMPKP